MSNSTDHMMTEPIRYSKEVRPSREWMYASDVDWIIERCRAEIRQLRAEASDAAVRAMKEQTR